MNCRADLLVGAAAADIGDGRVDVGIGGLRLGLEQGGDRHDHAALAVPALRYVALDPRLLHRVHLALPGQALDGHHLLAHRRDGGVQAGAHRLAVDVHGAGAALRHAAAVFGAGQADPFADRPEQRGIVGHVDVVRGAVNVESGHEKPPYWN
jgi:hypothetical protein